MPDHPRSRGVYFPAKFRVFLNLGSSPLARGLPGGDSSENRLSRIIPARAGFTTPTETLWRRTSDHPRSRGVYSLIREYENTHGGSSPLARGLLPQDRAANPQKRIIPARAGVTLEDPWNPNDESPYQTAFTFTADLALAPQSSDSAAVAQRSTRPPSEA